MGRSGNTGRGSTPAHMGLRMHATFASVVDQAVAQVKDIADPNERELALDNTVAEIAAELSDEKLRELAEAQPHLFRDRIPEYFPDGMETGVDLYERNLRELAVRQAQRELEKFRARAEDPAAGDDGPELPHWTEGCEQRDCANASPHAPHEWEWDGGKMWCYGKTDPLSRAGIFRVETDETGQFRFRSHIDEASRLLSELGQHPNDERPGVRKSLHLAATSRSGEWAARYILSELYLELVNQGVRDGWLYDELRSLLNITRTPEESDHEYRHAKATLDGDRELADAVLAETGVSIVDIQHPFNAATGKWMAHCVGCGTYVDDTDHEPAADFLCDDCEERDE